MDNILYKSNVGVVLVYVIENLVG